MRTTSSTGNNLFDQFWAAYPRKVGKDKAMRAFAKINPTEEQLYRILEELERQKKAYGWCKENWKYIPHPATWLNQKRWEDETIVAGTDIPEDESYGAFIY